MRIDRREAEKGAQGSGAGVFQRWTECQDSYAGRCTRRPSRFIVTADQRSNITQVPALLDGQKGKAVLADKAYDSNALRATIKATCGEAVIPSNRTCKIVITHDRIAAAQSYLTGLQSPEKLPPLRSPLRRQNHSPHRIAPSRHHDDLDPVNVDRL